MGRLKFLLSISSLLVVFMISIFISINKGVLKINLFESVQGLVRYEEEPTHFSRLYIQF